jgi:crotonobetainyl-CoA:carnitine CoA-transferase CaiB-like acyl-CoA transferase
MSNESLQGLKILEMTEAWAGPVCASLMGDMGADVIKIESFPRHSLTRPTSPRYATMPGEGPVYERDALHHQGNRNKRNMAIDIRKESGKEILKKLLLDADVFIEGYAAGKIEKLGFGWQDVQKINPNITMISIAGWGLEGPYKNMVTLGAGLDATTGHLSLRGYPQGDFVDTHPNFHSDATGSSTIFFAALTALLQRKKEKKGTFIDLSQWEGLVWQFPAILAEWTMNQRIPERLGNNDPHIVPHGAYRTIEEDKWIVVAAEDDNQWQGLCEVIDKIEWTDITHQYSSIVGRIKGRVEIDAAIESFTKQYEGFTAAEILQNNHVIASPVVTPPDVLLSNQLHDRDWHQTVTHKWTGPIMVGGHLWNVEPDTLSWDIPTALVGQHNEEILTELGFDRDYISDLYANGTIGNHYEN